MGAISEDTPAPGQIEREIEATRERLGRLLAELGRRRHELTDVSLQVRRHVVPLAIAGGALLCAGAVGIAYAIHRHRSATMWPERARRVRKALGRMAAHPELVAKPRPNVAAKLLTAAGTSVVGILARRLVQQALDRSRRARLSGAGVGASYAAARTYGVTTLPPS